MFVVIDFFFEMPYSTDVDTHTRTGTHPYDYTHIISLWTSSKDWAGLILRFTESIKERLTIDMDVDYY
jgi:hypothetical protein